MGHKKVYINIPSVLPDTTKSSSINNRILLFTSHALALSAVHFFLRKEKSLRVCTSMHSPGLERTILLLVVRHWCGALPYDNTGTKVGPRTIPRLCSIVVLFRTRNVVTSGFHRTKLRHCTKGYRTKLVHCTKGYRTKLGYRPKRYRTKLRNRPKGYRTNAGPRVHSWERAWQGGTRQMAQPHAPSAPRFRP